MIERMKRLAERRTPIALGLVIALIFTVLGLTMISENSGSRVVRKPIYEISAVFISSDMADYLRNNTQSMKEMAFGKSFLSMKKEAGYRYQKTKQDPQAGYYLMKIELGHDLGNDSVLHLLGLFGQNFSAFDELGTMVCEYRTPFLTRYYTSLLSEQYIHTKSETLYVIAAYSRGDLNLGMIGEPELMDVSDSLKFAMGAYQTRHAIAIFLILLSILLLTVAHNLNAIRSKETIGYISVFSCLFGAWILTDFSRQTYNIMSSYEGVPSALLLLIYCVSKNYMSWAFVKMNSYFLEKPFSLKVMRVLIIEALIAGAFEMIMDVIRFFTWNPIFYELKNLSYIIMDWTIILGSLILFGLALYEAFENNIKARILSIGLAVCLFTFFVSQTTDLLVSHWGVIALAGSISIILTNTYNEAQRKMVSYMEDLKEKNKEMEQLNFELEYAQTELLLRLGGTVDMRSHETSMHVQRVAKYTKLIAKEIGMTEEEAEMLSMASTLHDVGKVGTPDSILNSPNKLTSLEYNEMKRHAKMGYEILNGSMVQILDIAAIVALTHHERFDGGGYPDGLKGEEIPVQGRIVAVADVFDALLSPRVYKKAWTLDEVFDHFTEESGRHFEPRIVEAILRNREALIEIMRSMPYEKE